jgi:hypothetical protein
MSASPGFVENLDGTVEPYVRPPSPNRVVHGGTVEADLLLEFLKRAGGAATRGQLARTQLKGFVDDAIRDLEGLGLVRRMEQVLRDRTTLRREQHEVIELLPGADRVALMPAGLSRRS